MKNKTTESLPSLADTRRSLHMRVAAAGLAVVAVVGGYAQNEHNQNQKGKIATLQESNYTKDKQLDRLAKVTAAVAGVNKDTVTGKNLEKVDKLPGYGLEVSAEKEKLLQDSALQVVRRFKNAGPSYWQPHCTANKVSVGGEIYIVSAKHCFDDDIVGGGKGGVPTEPTAINIINEAKHEYAVVEPGTELGEGIEPPILSRINGIAVDISGNDWALLNVPHNKGPVSEAFLAKPSLEYTTSTLPTPGQEAALYGLPAASENQPIKANGTYLGRIFDDRVGNHFDLIGISADVPNKDACNFGASGSSAILSEGYATGPLAWRNNINFGESAQVNAGDDPQSGQLIRLNYEDELHLDLSGYSTICSFGIAYNRTLPSLAGALHSEKTK